ncbi:MAG: heavy metal-responsive transcriptional regulator [Mariprofundaceae bacterium]|nr:heavy metal-responsive transcriptional regulator [Mariprofundaceae bacterium]
MLYTSAMKIGELSKMTGVSIDTVRYYEKRGLIPSPVRSRAGYRQYGEHDAKRLLFIVQAKGLGFTLEEIGQLLALRSDGRACVEVRSAAQSKAQEIDLKIQKLSQVRQTLLELASECEKSATDDPCPILKSLEK